MATISLVETAITAKKNLRGGDIQVILPGQKVDLKVGDIELLDEIVPQGKSWEVHINVHIIETDAQ